MSGGRRYAEEQSSDERTLPEKIIEVGASIITMVVLYNVLSIVVMEIIT